MKQLLNARHAAALFIIAFAIRATVMALVIQPHEFYKQSDSVDYHHCALMIATGNGMFRSDIKEPIFWRTPGYPPYLALFYRLVGISHTGFKENRTAQLLALWVQILCASCIPIILFYLAYLLTAQKTLAMVVAWTSVFHPGLVLASTYLLTEGLALIFFYLFLFFLFKILLNHKKTGVNYPILAALMLAIYTWMRPMGELVALFTILLIALLSTASWAKKIKHALLFALVFFASIAPWYVRNHALTGQWFFCPTIGTYLTCFSVPKILHRTLNKPLEECLKIAQYNASMEVEKERKKLIGTGKYVSNHACKNFAYPVIMHYPGYFLYDWTQEVIKTTFDLYCYQLIPMINGSYWYDPIQEYLPEKIAACLYAHPMPWYARVVCWLEFVIAIFTWIGIIAGSVIFLRTPQARAIWFYTLLIIGLIVGMTGGFGYARLRLPAEPLILILALSFWFWLYEKRTINHKAIS